MMEERGATELRNGTAGVLDQQLFDRGVLWNRAGRFVGPNDAQRHHDGSRPGRHVVDVDREPQRQQHQLRRYTGALGPLVLPEDRQVDLGERVAGVQSAFTANDFAGSFHMRQVGVVTDQLQDEVCLDRRAQLRTAARIAGPAPVRKLLRPQKVGRLAHPVLISPAQVVQQEHVLTL